MTAPTRMKISDSGAAAACQRVMRSTMTYGKMLKASPKNARTKMPTDPVNGTHAHEQGECPGPGPGLKPGDVAAEHHALRERRDQRAGMEGAVPPAFLNGARLHAEVEGDASQDEPDQHDRHRQVKLAEDDAVRDWKRRQQQAYAEDQP